MPPPNCPFCGLCHLPRVQFKENSSRTSSMRPVSHPSCRGQASLPMSLHLLGRTDPCPTRPSGGLCPGGRDRPQPFSSNLLKAPERPNSCSRSTYFLPAEPYLTAQFGERCLSVETLDPLEYNACMANQLPLIPMKPLADRSHLQSVAMRKVLIPRLQIVLTRIFNSFTARTPFLCI